MSADRKTTLLLLAAEALDEMRDPFEHSFLVENAVTADECYDLSANLALGARMLSKTTRELNSGSVLVRSVAAARLVDAVLP